MAFALGEAAMEGPAGRPTFGPGQRADVVYSLAVDRRGSDAHSLRSGQALELRVKDLAPWSGQNPEPRTENQPG
jgi:hypothetical protein